LHFISFSLLACYRLLVSTCVITVMLTGGGVIGISFVPDVGETPNVGGICEERRAYGESPALKAGVYNLNTLLISQLTRSERIADGITTLTVTHEIGHSFGSHHDDNYPHQPDCLPGSDSQFGNYIMAAGVPKRLELAHNWMFSVCSRRSMKPVISHPSKTSCFKRRRAPYCGNGVVEESEQCDCGTTYTCHVYDKCCVPLSVTKGVSVGTACMLKVSSKCSPRVHRCCTSACTVASAGITCRQKTDCASASHCDGSSKSCPAPRLAADGTSCADGRGTCTAGVCSMSLCKQAGLVDCMCRHPRNHACSVCCRCGTAPEDACVPAQWLHLLPTKQASHTVLLLPDADCVDGGTCDNDARCLSPQARSALAALLNATSTSPPSPDVTEN